MNLAVAAVIAILVLLIGFIAARAAAGGGNSNLPCGGVCAGALPACDPATNTCVACLFPDASTCGGATPFCRPDNKCGPCTGDADCGGATPYCAAGADGPRCVACVDGRDCGGATPYCVAGADGPQCAQCRTDGDCAAGAGPGRVGRCAGGRCRSAPACYSWAGLAADPARPAPLAVRRAVGYPGGPYALLAAGGLWRGTTPILGSVTNDTTPLYYDVFSDLTTATPHPKGTVAIEYLTAAAGCPTTPPTTTDPRRAVTYRGVPVCIASTTAGSMFAPYDTASGQCAPIIPSVADFSLLADPGQW